MVWGFFGGGREQWAGYPGCVQGGIATRLRPHNHQLCIRAKANNPLLEDLTLTPPEHQNKFLQKGILAGRGRGIKGSQTVPKKASQRNSGRRKENGTHLWLGCPAPKLQEDTPLTHSPDVVGLSYLQIGRRAPRVLAGDTFVPPFCSSQGLAAPASKHTHAQRGVFRFSSSNPGSQKQTGAANWPQEGLSTRPQALALKKAI